MSTHKFWAVLIIGATFFLRDDKFENGVPVPVDEETGEYLQENAVDNVTVAGKPQAIKKFAIVDYNPKRMPNPDGTMPDEDNLTPETEAEEVDDEAERAAQVEAEAKARADADAQAEADAKIKAEAKANKAEADAKIKAEAKAGTEKPPVRQR